MNIFEQKKEDIELKLRFLGFFKIIANIVLFLVTIAYFYAIISLNSHEGLDVMLYKAFSFGNIFILFFLSTVPILSLFLISRIKKRLYNQLNKLK